MALVLADLGADVILGTFFVATAVQDLVLKLYVTDVTPSATGADVIGDYTEAVGGGYAEKALARGAGWTLTVADDPSDVIYTQQTFTFTGPLTTNTTIYGYYVTNAAETVLLWAEKLAQSFAPYNNGDQLLITPKFQLSKGTPS